MTAVQGDLFRPASRAEEKFRAFHEANPHVYRELLRLALEMRRRGREKWGIAGIFEVLRWNRAMQTDAPDYKLCNTHRAFYARMLMEQEPELRGFFDLRQSVADGAFEGDQ